MTTYNVHIYREMRLVFGGIEADTHEAAAAIAGDKPTDQADSIDDCDGETLAALVDVAGDEDYRHTRAIDFEPERERKAARRLLDACRMVVAGWERGDLAEAARACSAAIAEAEMAGPHAEASDPATKPYSVLLLYPDYANDGGKETYYAFVEAPDSVAAIADARRQAVAANDGAEIQPDDFAPLLVTEGHHYGQPVSNQ
jgi:hypothetical protein